MDLFKGGDIVSTEYGVLFIGLCYMLDDIVF